MAAAIALTAALALAASASAEIVEFYPTPAMPAVRATVTFSGGEVREACPVTLSGSLSTPQITLTTGATLGAITRIETSRCSPEGTLTVLALPWTVRYRSIGGTLPEGVRELNLVVNGFAGRLALFGGLITCLYGGTAEATAPMARGSDPYEIEVLRLAGTIPLVAGAPCPAAVTLSGTGIFAALWSILFGESLPMRAVPAWTTKARSAGGVAIAVTALQNVTVTSVVLEQNNRGWVLTLPAGGCNRAYMPGEAKETCTVTINGAAATGDDKLLFKENARVVAKVPLNL